MLHKNRIFVFRLLLVQRIVFYHEDLLLPTAAGYKQKERFARAVRAKMDIHVHRPLADEIWYLRSTIDA